MNDVIAFVRGWYEESSELLRRGDPLIMGAAIAYNALFALVPLALGLVALSTFFDEFDTIIDDLDAWMHRVLPDEVASFMSTIIADSFDVISGERAVVVLVALVVAFWSGSRAVYATQKALRLVQGIEDDRGYVRSRATGVVVTLGAFVAIGVAYGVLVVGMSAWDWLVAVTPLGPIGVRSVVSVGVLFIIVAGLLFVVYEYGPPQPLDHALLSAVLVASIVMVGSWAMALVIPQIDTATLAVLGSIGLVLVWLYSAGVVMIAIPIAIIGLFGVLENRSHR